MSGATLARHQQEQKDNTIVNQQLLMNEE